MSGRVDRRTQQRIATELARHPSIAAAAVQGDDQLIAYLVPDEWHAPVVHRGCRMAAAGSLAGLSLYEPAGELLVAQLNRTETDFLYREIFVENAYLRHGIGLPAAPVVVVDVGANIGMFSLLVAQRSSGARIFAVEPVAELAHAVSVNAELHGADVTVLTCSLGRCTGEVAFSYYPHNTLMSGMYGDAEEDRAVLRSYLRTALELHRRYGLRKFIVVVPSVAIREGVLKSLKITQDHLRELYDNVPYRFTVYDSRSIAKVRQFSQSDCVEILVMTIDAFNNDDNVIRQSTDRLQGATPIFLVQDVRPVLILDEPQNMESEGRIKALAALHQAGLRDAVHVGGGVVAWVKQVYPSLPMY